ncbi:Crp/Fnr family transcriptional regulator [Variovorax boronicumulans]|uniref:Crp/Fnr family transcriptional regulator n=1 Tax=Variovorax boronicumulans TaxID=436515 RepID=UPI00339331A0
MTAIRNTAADTVSMENALRMNPAFSQWPRDAMARLLASSRTGRHAAGTVFLNELREKTETFLVVSGEAMLTLVSRDGDQFDVMILGPGMLMGMAQMFSGPTRAALAYRAHSDVVAIHMPTRLIVEALDEQPVLWKDMMFMMTRQSAAQVRTVSSQIAGSLRQRVAATVDRLAALYGTSVAGESCVRLRVSQATLATLLQANRQAVHRELKAIAASGAIDLAYKAIVVKDFEMLRCHAVEARSASNEGAAGSW